MRSHNMAFLVNDLTASAAIGVCARIGLTKTTAKSIITTIKTV